ncbi:hypothetical protein I7X13_18290 [Hymenobacter sp. BT442]|uniref:Uncharacterized protein n=2 Tax=Hymenobacter negativus TaxID=2795026 RepID=A0ABS0QBG1_9BACT|nr:hypothetical protein [Hymenobacter negativus]
MARQTANLTFVGVVCTADMATPPLPPATQRLVGLLLIFSGALLGIGLLLKVAVGAYSWNAGRPDSPSAFMLSVNLVGLLASGLLMRVGLRMRRGTSVHRNPNADEIL